MSSVWSTGGGFGAMRAGLVPILIALSVIGLLVVYFKALDSDLKRSALPRSVGRR